MLTQCKCGDDVDDAESCIVQRLIYEGRLTFERRIGLRDVMTYVMIALSLIRRKLIHVYFKMSVDFIDNTEE